MNIPQAVERAFADLIRGYDIGGKTIIRCWHGLKNDYRWKADNDKTYPLIDVRIAPPKMTVEDNTLVASCAIVVQTLVEDDEDHMKISGYEQAVQEALDDLFSQFRAQTGDKWTAFQASIIADCAGVSIGGLTFGDGLPPYDDDGVNAVGMSMDVHYSRSVFN